MTATTTYPQTSEFYTTGEVSDGDYSYRLCLSPSVHYQWEEPSMPGKVLKYLYKKQPVAGIVAVRKIGIGQYSVSEAGTVAHQDIHITEFVRSVGNRDRIGAVNDLAVLYPFYESPNDRWIIPKSVADSRSTSGSSNNGAAKM
ncbi:uncharacterized protein ARMOST_04917 [Armillaria ostoyae]|uniref:Uncharacterized protein n=1 Tax=Armillaria ostoyae TaxID=47428 RepID=A0A284QYT9_ARMOS|nr:uncharacterized protein ARMOST_04917 [Armillaria ostoyae]